jgi:hypothetical protein
MTLCIIILVTEMGEFALTLLLRSAVAPPFLIVLESKETKVGQDPVRRLENDFTWIKMHGVCELSQSEGNGS